VGDVWVTIGQTSAEDRQEVSQVADRFRSGRRNAALVLFGSGGRGAIHVAVTDDLVQRGLTAGGLLNRIAAITGGRGGGRPGFASGSLGDPTRLDAARRAVPTLVAEWLNGR
jgi:alanyl-tRNA synthetase